MKLEIYNYFPDTTRHAKVQGASSTWVVWVNSQFDAWKFLFIFVIFATATGRIFGHIPTLNTSLYVVLAEVVPFGVRKIKCEIWPPFTPQNVKIAALIGTCGEEVKGQGHKVTQGVKNCNNSVVGGPINFIVGGWHTDVPPKNSGAQTGCHCNVGCVAIAPRNLHFSQIAINFKISTYVQHDLPVMWPNFGENRSKVEVTRAHTCNVYS